VAKGPGDYFLSTVSPRGPFRNIAVVGRARMDGRDQPGVLLRGGDAEGLKKQDLAPPFLQPFILAEMGLVH